MLIILLFISYLVIVQYIYFKSYSKIYKNINKKAEKWTIIIISTGILFLVIKFSYEEWVKILGNSLGFSDGIEIPIVITIIMAFVAKLRSRDSSSFLMSERSNESALAELTDERIYKSVSKMDSDKITTYPIITIHDTTIEGEDMIFDSSDFSIIRGAFNDFDNYTTLKEGKYFNLNGKEY